MKLKSIHIKGYKSINSEGQTIDFNDITVLLGANGSGKSNLVSFFSILDSIGGDNVELLTLQKFVGKQGGANNLLHYGAKTTLEIEGRITIGDLSVDYLHIFVLSYGANDTLFFKESELFFKESDEDNYIYSPKNISVITIYRYLKQKTFQFHDTSNTSPIRTKGYLNDNQYLQSDGGNLAAFLYFLKEKQEKYYNRIIRYIQQVMPQFGTFDLNPSPLNENYILLNWRDKKNDYLFGPHQISDGALRFMCLATLLLQPSDLLPSIIILDEPELGLHPSAISLLAGMIKATSKYSQIILATQSPRLVDEFEVEDIVIVERNAKEGNSEFKRLNEDKLNDWLERYSLSELWEKNVLGGQP